MKISRFGVRRWGIPGFTTNGAHDTDRRDPAAAEDEDLVDIDMARPTATRGMEELNGMTLTDD